ncbi:hypothetical protein BDN70DRAFT_549838 [Pholiota conissans]|uniref:Uncharacterized protein n=1 Tax=Pholiota conissans TaxID=109636 RepID=A0A9P5Z583_9AGAR|nr:hypothetical protein BDN70DRAFT_549838 [Pholiota conissans]
MYRTPTILARGTAAYKDPRVFQRLALDRVSAQFAANCSEAFKEEQQLQLEDGAGDSEKAAIFTTEVLASLFRHVEGFTDSSDTQTEHTLQSSKTWRFSKGCSSFVLLERPPSQESTTTKDYLLSKHALSFCVANSPPHLNLKLEESLKYIVNQAQKCAGFHLSSQDSQLFSVVLVAFQSTFCVTMFDRIGMTLSPIHNLWDDMEKFICIVRSLTCLLSPFELGRVVSLPLQQHTRRSRGSSALLSSFELGRDSFVVSSPPQQHTHWSRSIETCNAAPLQPVLDIRRRPLLAYTSEKELLLGMHSTVRVHQSLYQRGVSLRRITAGRVMLASHSSEGILMDLDIVNAGSKDDFMAARSSDSASAKPESQQDIESFINVLSYTVAKRALLDADKQSDFDPATLYRLRSQLQVLGSITSRQAWWLLKFPSMFPMCFSSSIIDLFASLSKFLLSYKGDDPQKITHEGLLRLLDNAIGKMN